MNSHSLYHNVFNHPDFKGLPQCPQPLLRRQSARLVTPRVQNIVIRKLVENSVEVRTEARLPVRCIHKVWPFDTGLGLLALQP